MVRRAFKIPLQGLFGVCFLLILGEVACGTEAWFAIAMGTTCLCAGITYNLLGGLNTISGIAFMVFVLRTVAISQLAKILFHQPADSLMQDPPLTATVYVIFYAAAMVGAFVFSQVCINLPKAKEPDDESQLRTLYAIALALGGLGEILVQLTQMGTASRFNSAHSTGIALSALLRFAVVLAVDLRIRKTGGRHSLGLAAIVPAALLAADGIFDTSRQAFLEPVALYFLTGWSRCYRFRLKHLLAITVLGPIFVLFISPLALYTRASVVNIPFKQRITRVWQTASTADWRQITAVENAVSGSPDYEDYYELPGTTVLSRLSRIRMDSNLIAACKDYHYEFTALRTDLLLQVPRVLMKDKPNYDASDFLGRISGVSAGIKGVTEPAFTMIADSFGAFGFPGVILVAFFILPLALSVFDQMFVMDRPWGTFALVLIAMSITEGGAASFIAVVLIRIPIYLFLLSYLSVWIAKLRPAPATRWCQQRRVLPGVDSQAIDFSSQ